MCIRDRPCNVAPNNDWDMKMADTTAFVNAESFRRWQYSIREWLNFPQATGAKQTLVVIRPCFPVELQAEIKWNGGYKPCWHQHPSTQHLEWLVLGWTPSRNSSELSNHTAVKQMYVQYQNFFYSSKHTAIKQMYVKYKTSFIAFWSNMLNDWFCIYVYNSIKSSYTKH